MLICTCILCTRPKWFCLTMVDIHFFLEIQITDYERKYTTPSWVCTIPIFILQCFDETSQGGTTRQQAITDLSWIDFFLLFCSGEYFQGVIDKVSTPFHLQYIQFYIDITPFPDTTANPYNCATESFVSLLFTTQNNWIKGESIRNGKTGNPRECAVATITRRVAHLQRHSASSRMLLLEVSKNVKFSTIRIT